MNHAGIVADWQIETSPVGQWATKKKKLQQLISNEFIVKVMAYQVTISN